MKYPSTLWLFVMLISGCGGGSANIDPSSGLDADNALQTLRSIYSANFSATTQSSKVISSSQTDGNTGLALPMSGIMAHQAALGSRVSALASSRHLAASTTSTQMCQGGGSLTFSFNDADRGGTLSTGDVLSMQATECVERGHRLNGQISLSLDEVYGFSDVSVFSFRGTVHVSSFVDIKLNDNSKTETNGSSLLLHLTRTDINVKSSIFDLENITQTITIGNVNTSVRYDKPYECGLTSAISIDTTLSCNGALVLTSNQTEQTYYTDIEMTSAPNSVYPYSGKVSISEYSTKRRLLMTALSNSQVSIQTASQEKAPYSTYKTYAWSDIY